MHNQSTHALSPLDGRYHEVTSPLREYFSEAAYHRTRLYVELKWVEFLLGSPEFGFADEKDWKGVQGLLADFSWFDPEKVRVHEAQTNHDVKALEYTLRDEFRRVGLSHRAQALIHIGCTSEDVNNLAYGLMLKSARHELILPKMSLVIQDLREKSTRWAHLTMLSRTHGQPASPTTVGKELRVFAERLRTQMELFRATPISGKWNGSVGAYHGFLALGSQLNWPNLSKRFVEEVIGLVWNPWTTQIESHDRLSEMLDHLRRYESVALDLCGDVWAYIGAGYFAQKKADSEVGSSVMPHKVNPIDFENAEGNFGLSSALSGFMSTKLLRSRLQRDLSDSTVLRSLGSVFGYHLVAQSSLLKGLGKIEVQEGVLSRDLEGRWELLGEAVQTVLRAHGVVDAYERLKAMTRGQSLSRAAYQEYVSSLAELPEESREWLKSLRPESYSGLASDLAL